MSAQPAVNLVPPPHLAREAGAEEARISIDGVGFRYLRAGSGPPLLLLHGLLGYSFSWRKNIAALAQVSTLYAPDFPGTGYSDRTPIGCSFSSLAHVMLKFMDALGIDRATLLGTSHGGAVAMTMAALDREQHRRRIERLVLVSSVNPYSVTGRKRIALFSSPLGAFLLLHAGPVLKNSHSFFLKRMYGDPRRITPGTLDGYAAAIAVPGTIEHLLARVKCWPDDIRILRDTLPKIADLPTMLIWGTRDTAVPVSSLEPLSRNFHNVRTVILEGAGHLPYEEVPEEFNRVLLDFLCSE